MTKVESAFQRVKSVLYSALLLDFVAPSIFEEVELIKSAFKVELNTKQTLLFEKQTLLLS